MHKYIDRLKSLLYGKSGNVFHGMLVLMVGTSAGRVINLAAMPLLTRIYKPDDFGTLALFTAIVAILSPLVTLRYSLTLPLPRSDSVAINLLVLSFIFMSCFSLIIASLLWLYGATILKIFSMEALAPWWWLIAVAVLTTAFYETLTFWATRRLDYKTIAITNVWQSIFGSLIKILLGLLSLKSGGLLIGQVVTQSCGIGRFLSNYRSDIKKNARFIRPKRLIFVAWRYRSFPFFRVPSQLLLVLAQQAPVFLTAAIFGNGVTGQLSLALMALAVPVNLLANNTAKAFYAEASRLGAKQSRVIQELLKDITIKLTILAIIPTFILLFAGEWLFSFLFGAEWQLAGEFASALAIYILLQFLQTPVSHVFYIFDGQMALLLINLQRILLIVAVFALAHTLHFTIIETIWTYSLTIGLHYGLSIFYTFRYISKQVKS